MNRKINFLRIESVLDFFFCVKMSDKNSKRKRETDPSKKSNKNKKLKNNEENEKIVNTSVIANTQRSSKSISSALSDLTNKKSLSIPNAQRNPFQSSNNSRNSSTSSLYAEEIAEIKQNTIDSKFPP